jgi:hypothetical protein
MGVGYFGYHRKFVDHYIAIERPLQVLKTRGLKGAPAGKQKKRTDMKCLLDQTLPDITLYDTDLLSEYKQV